MLFVTMLLEEGIENLIACLTCCSGLHMSLLDRTHGATPRFSGTKFPGELIGQPCAEEPSALKLLERLCQWYGLMVPHCLTKEAKKHHSAVKNSVTDDSIRNKCCSLTGSKAGCCPSTHAQSGLVKKVVDVEVCGELSFM